MNIRNLKIGQSVVVGSKNMIGFKSSRYKPVRVVHIESSFKYGKGPNGESKREYFVNLKVEPDAENKAGLERLEKILGDTLISAAEQYDEKKKDFHARNVFLGEAEIGKWHEQQSYSDDGYYGVRADTDELAKAVAEALQKAIPISGGGVPGSYGYKGSGLKANGNEYVYHQSSFGIGD